MAIEAPIRSAVSVGRTFGSSGRFLGAILLTVGAALALASCGDGDDPAPPPTTPISPTPDPTTPQPPPGPTLQSIELRGLPESVSVGDGFQLEAWAIYSEGDPERVPEADASWATSNPDIATVDEFGFVRVRSPGPVRITAVWSDRTAFAGFDAVPRPDGEYQLRGAISNLGGHPIAGALVAVLDGESRGRSAITDLAGMYSLLLVGDARISATKGRYQAGFASVRSADPVADFRLAWIGPPQSSFGPGRYIVGEEIAPGRYFAAPDGECEWRRRSHWSISPPAGSGVAGLSDPDLGLIAFRLSDADHAQEIVDIGAADRVFAAFPGCGDWTTTPQPSPSGDRIPAGAWLVGAQVAPGTYRADAGEGCYWARLSGFGGEEADVIEDDFRQVPGPVTITIESGDAGFLAHPECGPWLPQP